jgi:hypothetical protein
MNAENVDASAGIYAVDEVDQRYGIYMPNDERVGVVIITRFPGTC